MENLLVVRNTVNDPGLFCSVDLVSNVLVDGDIHPREPPSSRDTKANHRQLAQRIAVVDLGFPKKLMSFLHQWVLEDYENIC